MLIKKNVKEKEKEQVKLRYKTIANGNKSIYLDYYHKGKREYDFLRLYLIPEMTVESRNVNINTLKLANILRDRKIIELQNVNHNFNNISSDNISSKHQILLIEYLQLISSEKKMSLGNATKGLHQTYNALINHIKQYCGDQITFRQITKEFCYGFIEYLSTTSNMVYAKGRSEIFTSGLLSNGTKHIYIKTFSTLLNKAVKHGILKNNPLKSLPTQLCPKRQINNREYLTIDEVKKLVKTPCMRPLVKNAFLFSCFSGLRFSDVRTLTWKQIQKDNEGKTIIRYIQKKTKKIENLQISDEALKFLPDRRNAINQDIVYPLPTNGYTNETLKTWIWAAGITKRVTFHVGRHTNATLLLSLGVPIETVSKLLGHSSIHTTQIYAKVIDKNKRDAVSKLDGLTGF